MNKPSTGILFGYGSIGRHHAGALADSVSTLCIVDPNEVARARALDTHPGAVIAP